MPLHNIIMTTCNIMTHDILHDVILYDIYHAVIYLDVHHDVTCSDIYVLWSTV